MDFIKTAFTIKDLENLSGIKKHTIRIWEKRYQLLSPERTKTNIRYYSTASLRHLLNIVLLYNNGYKISRIAKLEEPEILEHCKNLINESVEKNQFIVEMKMAMLSFDQQLFEKAFQRIRDGLPFSEIFREYFLPFLNEMGLLWQTNTINPAHEHFISNLIKQKILIHTEKCILQKPNNRQYKFILFLPDNEIHDLGLTYLNYEILRSGFPTVFLGQSVPVSCLNTFASNEGPLIFISYFTVQPEESNAHEYLELINSTILTSGNCELWILGRKTQRIHQDTLPERIRKFASTPEILRAIEGLKGN